MNNYNNTRPPRTGVIIWASFLFVAILSIACFNAYEQKAQALGHTVHITPASVHYGTVSSVTASAPMAVPMQHSAPLLGGHAIRSYAYSGHATMPKVSASGAGFKILTTSSASMHSYGSGGGGGTIGTSSGSSHGTSSSKGIQYGGGSVSLPVLAVASSSSAMSASFAGASSARMGIGPRRVPGYSGSEEGEIGEDGGKYWMWDGEEWIEQGDIPVGTTKIEGGKTYRWNGSSWDEIGDQQDPGLPLGDTPWLWMLLLIGIYLLARRKSLVF